MLVSPLSREWIHTHLLRPYIEGTERINRAWFGRELGSLAPRLYSSKQRVIYWITGTLLLCPLVNAILWIAWQAFKNPEICSDPYCPDLAPLHSAQPELPSFPVAQGAAEQSIFNERGPEGSPVQTTCKVTALPQWTVVEENNRRRTTRALYRPPGDLVEYHSKRDRMALDLWREPLDSCRLKARFTVKGRVQEKYLCLPENLPWIQHPTGLKPFILSEEKELFFYEVLTQKPMSMPWIENPPLLVKRCARKIGVENAPVYGPLLRIEVSMAWSWPFNRGRCTMWFDPASGTLKNYAARSIHL